MFYILPKAEVTIGYKIKVFYVSGYIIELDGPRIRAIFSYPSIYRPESYLMVDFSFNAIKELLKPKDLISLDYQDYKILKIIYIMSRTKKFVQLQYMFGDGRIITASITNVFSGKVVIDLPVHFDWLGTYNSLVKICRLAFYFSKNYTGQFLRITKDYEKGTIYVKGPEFSKNFILNLKSTKNFILKYGLKSKILKKYEKEI